MGKTSDENQKNPLINFRVEPAQKKAYEAAARKKRKALSVWIREILDAEAEKAGISLEQSSE